MKRFILVACAVLSFAAFANEPKPATDKTTTTKSETKITKDKAKQTTETKTVVDPPGLMNSTTTVSKSTVTSVKKADGGVETTTEIDHTRDAPGMKNDLEHNEKTVRDAKGNVLKHDAKTTP